jgi:phenylpyruvate tautomerase PptA (4-oxalocrotonate tautomerase family)
MPTVLIEVRKPRPRDDEVALMTAVHAALMEAFRIPEWDRNVRLVVHEPHRMLCPPDCDEPELYTQISIDAFAGRSLAAKRALYQAIVRNLEELGIPRTHVKIMIREVTRENWGIRGGQAACDVDLGFATDV